MKEPDKWCIKVTPENKEAIEKWRTVKAISECKGYCVNKSSFDALIIGYWYPDKPEGYTEISFEEFKVYTNISKDLTGRYVKCLVDGAQGTNCKAGEIYKLVSLVDTVEAQIYAIKNRFIFHISPVISHRWELLPEDYSANKPLKQAVHCKTQEEWDFVNLKMKFTAKFGISSCVRYLDDGYISSIEYFKKRHLDNYQLLSFQEWCDLNEYKMEKEVKFEVGKWYKNLGIYHQKNTFGKFKRLSGKNNNEFWMSECIYDGKQVDIKEQWLNYSNETIEASIEEIQQYLPNNHPDKIKSNQKFKVGDWVIVVSECLGYNGKLGKLYKAIENSDNGYFRYEDHLTINTKLVKVRFATPEEINNHLISIGQIPAEKYPFKKLEEDDLTWEIKTEGIRWTEPVSMANENWKSKMILSIDDEELPMVNIIKTNTIKQLLNND